jgi:hypothetical protein
MVDAIDSIFLGFISVCIAGGVGTWLFVEIACLLGDFNLFLVLNILLLMGIAAVAICFGVLYVIGKIIGYLLGM